MPELIIGAIACIAAYALGVYQGSDQSPRLPDATLRTVYRQEHQRQLDGRLGMHE